MTDQEGRETMQYTPGPWTIERHDKRIASIVGPWIDCDRSDGGDYTECRWDDAYENITGWRREIVHTDSGAYPPSEADAALICAAPDLLAAAKAALNDRMYREWPAIADLLKAAIAKAEGR